MANASHVTGLSSGTGVSVVGTKGVLRQRAQNETVPCTRRTGGWAGMGRGV